MTDQKNTDPMACPFQINLSLLSGNYTFAQAKSAISNLGTGWRMPTPVEASIAKKRCGLNPNSSVTAWADDVSPSFTLNDLAAGITMGPAGDPIVVEDYAKTVTLKAVAIKYV